MRPFAARIAAGAVVALGGVVTLQARRASRKAPRLLGFDPDAIDASVHARDGERVVWIGDSLAVGVGVAEASRALPARVARGLGRPVSLRVFGRSGARAADALEHLPAVNDYDPTWIFIEIGSNDVIHVTPRPRFRREMDALLAGAKTSAPRHVVVVGVGEFGATPLLPQPLRWLAARRADQIRRDLNMIAERHGAIFVDVVARSAAAFYADPDRFHAEDGFHPSDHGIGLWADATLGALRDAGILDEPSSSLEHSS